MFNKTLIASSLLSLGLVLTGCANNATKADNNHPHPMPAQIDGEKAPKFHKGMEKMGEHHFDKLDLTDAQKQQTKALEDQTRQQMQTLHASLKTQTDNIDKQKQAGADTATLLKLYEQRQATEEQLHNLHKTSQQQFLAILTPEQKLKMYEAHGKNPHAMGGDRPQQPPMPPKADNKKPDNK